MMFQRNYQIPRSRFFMLFLPTILTAAANNLTVFADSMITSRLCGADRLAAIQLVSPIDSLVSILYWTVGIGGSLLCFEYKAKSMPKEGDNVFATALAGLCSIVAVIILGCFIFKTPILNFLCARDELRSMTGDYYDMLVLCTLPMSYIMCLSYFLRADGRPVIPFAALLSSNLVNICMDFVLISVFKMDIRGAGLASLIGYITGAVIISIGFFRKKRNLHFALNPKTFFPVFGRIFTRGFPASSLQLFTTFRNILFNRVISGVGAAALITYSVFNSSLIVPFLFFVALSQTLSPIASFFYQEHDFGAVRYTAKLSALLCAAASGLFAAIVIACPSVVISMFGVQGAENIASASSAFRVLPTAYIGTGLVFILTFYLQAINKRALSSVISILDGFAIPSAMILISASLTGITGIWLSIAAAPFITLLFFMIYSLLHKTGLYMIPSRDTSFLIGLTLSPKPADIHAANGYIRDKLSSAYAPELADAASLAAEKLISDSLLQNPDITVTDVVLRDFESAIRVSVMDPGKKAIMPDNGSDMPLTGEARPHISVKTELARVVGINRAAAVVRRIPDTGT